jgi:hypothetical protein
MDALDHRIHKALTRYASRRRYIPPTTREEELLHEVNDWRRARATATCREAWKTAQDFIAGDLFELRRYYSSLTYARSVEFDFLLKLHHLT